MNTEPQREHQWLNKLVGEWTFESECNMPDQPPMKTAGSEVVRSFGGLWTLAEAQASDSGSGSWQSIMTLGYDPRIGRFVGTFIATMMTHLWIYNGSLDATGNVLTLDTEGSDFTQGGIIKYQDIIEISGDHRTLSSQTLGGDGKWIPFMKAHYRRKH